MKKLFYLLLSAVLLASPACSKKDDPQVDPNSLTPPNTVMVALNTAPPAALTKMQIFGATFGNPNSSLWLQGTMGDGRILDVRFYGSPGKVATATAAPIGEITLINAPAAVPTQVGAELKGSVANNPNTNLAQGTFEAKFPDGTTVKGTFRDLKTN